MLTNWLGSHELGIYNFVISWVVLAVIFAKLGFEEFLVRETASLTAIQKPLKANAIWIFSTAVVGVTSLTATLVMIAIAWRAEFESAGLRPAFYWGAALIPLLSILSMFRGKFRARKKVVLPQLAEYFIRPITTVTLLLSLIHI